MANDIKPHAQYYRDNEERAHESIDYFTYMQRVLRGMDWEEALTKPSKRWQPPEFYEWLEVAKQNGITEEMFKNRLKFGHDYEHAATYVKPSVKYEKYIPKALKNGIQLNVFYQRIRRGMDPEEAATKVIRKGKHIKFVELAEENGINRNMFFTRVHVRGLEPEEAATLPKNARLGYKQDLRFPDLTVKEDTLVNLLIAGAPVSRRLKAYYVQNKSRIDELVEERRG